jgi:hypothetical protein
LAVSGERVDRVGDGRVDPRGNCGPSSLRGVTQDQVRVAELRAAEQAAGERVGLVELASVQVSLRGPEQVAIISGHGVAAKTGRDGLAPVAMTG